MVAPSGEEPIRYDVEIESKAALASLSELLKTIEGNHNKVMVFYDAAVKLSQRWNMSILETIQLLQRMNYLQAGGKGGMPISSNLLQQTQLYATAKQQASELANFDYSKMNDVAKTNKQLWSEASNSFAKANTNIKQADATMRQFMNTVKGTLTAMLVFYTIQGITTVFQKIIDSVKQLEQSLLKLQIAERAISERGMDITPQDFENIIDKVNQTYETVSKIDAQKMVSSLAVLTKDLGLTAEQYEKLALAIPLVAQQSGESIESATEQIINGLTKSGRGWADLGITVDANIIKQRAIADGLVESAAAFDKLTAAQKQTIETSALINILTENTAGNLKDQDQYLDSISGKQARLTASWEEFATLTGEVLAPAIKLVLDTINILLQVSIDRLEFLKEVFVGYMTVILAQFMTFQELLQGNITSLDEWSKAYQKNIQLAQQSVEESMSGGARGEDTPTGQSDKVAPEMENEQADLQKALDEMNQEILEAQLKLKQDMIEAAIDLGRKLVDIEKEYARKRADAAREYANDVRDINRDYQQELEDIAADQEQAQEEYRQREEEREREFQNRMQELRENFLMDLEDALHARDARQVLRLIKQYNLDKLQAERQHRLDQQSAREQEELRQQEFERRRRQAEEDRQAALEEAQIRYQDKLEELARDEAAEKEAAQLAYKRKIEDLQRETRDHLEMVAYRLQEEMNLTQEGLNALLQMYSNYYSQIASMAASTNTSPPPPQSPPSLGAVGSVGNGGTPTVGGTLIGAGTGGIISGWLGSSVTIPNRNKQTTDFSKFSADRSMGETGKVAIELWLSPDLESRIINNSMDRTAEVITRVGRSK